MNSYCFYSFKIKPISDGSDSLFVVRNNNVTCRLIKINKNRTNNKGFSMLWTHTSNSRIAKSLVAAFFYTCSIYDFSAFASFKCSSWNLINSF